MSTMNEARWMNESRNESDGKVTPNTAEYRLFHRALLQKKPMICIQLLDESHLKYRVWWYGVATISVLLKIIGLFCKRAL